MMLKRISLLRSLYAYAAALALIHWGAALAGLSYVVVTGKIDAADVRRAVTALRGEQEGKADSLPVEAAKSSPAPGDGHPQVDNLAAKAQMDIEILQREAERVKVELAQRLALNKSILVQVENERDALRREQELQRRRAEESEKQVRDEGFERQMAIFEALNPKVAVQHLLGMPDQNEAARILQALEPDRARKIIEAAKRNPELSQMQMIVQKVRDSGPLPVLPEREVMP